jgi:hypothetical protein
LLNRQNTSNSKRKFQSVAAFAALLLLAGTISCKGFFVNSPNAVTISPSTISLTQGQSQQLKALASFDSGPSQDVTKSSVWDSSSGCAIGVSTVTLGNVTAVGSGSPVTITATFNGVSGTATVTGPTGITVSPCGTFAHGTTQTFSATLSGSDVTASSTWTSSDTNIVSFANASSSVATIGPNTGTVTITANNGSSTGQLSVTVN